MQQVSVLGHDVADHLYSLVEHLGTDVALDFSAAGPVVLGGVGLARQQHRGLVLAPVRELPEAALADGRAQNLLELLPADDALDALLLILIVAGLVGGRWLAFQITEVLGILLFLEKYGSLGQELLALLRFQLDFHVGDLPCGEGLFRGAVRVGLC